MKDLIYNNYNIGKHIHKLPSIYKLNKKRWFFYLDNKYKNSKYFVNDMKSNSRWDFLWVDSAKVWLIRPKKLI
jgi:hypothetical protein